MAADMERGNAKHGPRLDDEMAKEVEGHIEGSPAGSRAEQWHEPEPAGEDQPESTVMPGGPRRGGAPAPLTGEEVEARSQLGRYLPRSVLPADRGQLRQAAAEQNAPDAILDELARLPEDRQFRTVSEVWAALGHHNEEHRW
jgi:Protein of unknown function (DUF2795)